MRFIGGKEMSNKPYTGFEPKWVKEAAPKDSYRSIFRWGDPDFVKSIKVELEDGTIWDAKVSDENTVIIDCTPEYMSYYEWNYGGGNEFPTSIDNEYQFEDVKVLGVL